MEISRSQVITVNDFVRKLASVRTGIGKGWRTLDVNGIQPSGRALAVMPAFAIRRLQLNKETKLAVRSCPRFSTTVHSQVFDRIRASLEQAFWADEGLYIRRCAS